eukprot:jgi/Chlat1/54/ChrspC238811S00931
MATAAASAASLNVALLYRHILKAAQRYPSVKRADIIREIKTEFHQNKSLRDSQQIVQCRQAALHSLQSLQAYAGLDNSSPDWEVYLKGSGAVHPSAQH